MSSREPTAKGKARYQRGEYTGSNPYRQDGTTFYGPPPISRPTSWYVERSAETRRMEMELRRERRRQGKPT